MSAIEGGCTFQGCVTLRGFTFQVVYIVYWEVYLPAGVSSGGVLGVYMAYSSHPPEGTWDQAYPHWKDMAPGKPTPLSLTIPDPLLYTGFCNCPLEFSSNSVTGFLFQKVVTTANIMK